MGGLMVFHWLIVIGFIVVPIAVVVVIVRLVSGASRKSVDERNAASAATPPPASVEMRPARLDALRSKRLITDAEYAQRRADILRGL